MPDQARHPAAGASREQARIIRKAIHDLAGLLTGGAAIHIPIGEAEARGSARASRRSKELMTTNAGLEQAEIDRTIAKVSSDLAAGASLPK